MWGQEIAAWVCLCLISAGLFGFAIGLYCWKKQQLNKRRLPTTVGGNQTFDAMRTSELNRAGNPRDLMQAPDGRRAPSTGYDAPYGLSSQDFQPRLEVPMSLKIDEQMTSTANASLFENPYFTDREFQFPKIAHQSSKDVYADDSIEIDDSYVGGIKIKGITSMESQDHAGPQHSRPVLTSSSEFALDDDDDNLDAYIAGKLDLQGITTGESSDDLKGTANNQPRRKISAGHLKYDEEMNEARRLSADIRGTLPNTLQLGRSDPDSDNDLVIINKSDLDNSNSPRDSSGELSPSFETIDPPSMTSQNENASGAASILDRLNFKGFIKDNSENTESVQGQTQSSLQNPDGAKFSGISNPLFVDTTDTQGGYPSSSGAPKSDASLGSDISVIGTGKDDLGDFSSA